MVVPRGMHVSNYFVSQQFEAKCRFMRMEFSLEWDSAGFYSQLETDRCYTWFKLGFDQAKAIQSVPLAS